MSNAYPKPVTDIIEQFSQLPGIGPKSAQRIAFYLLQRNTGEAVDMMELIAAALKEVKYCGRCFNFSLSDLCEICSNATRDTHILCVVEDPRDVARVERTGEFKGLYHILGGAINSMDGIGPDQLNIKELIDRVRDEEIAEVIVATNPNSEGEYTALYIAQQLAGGNVAGSNVAGGVNVTRPASGLPIGGELEYADDLTLGRALNNRQQVNWN